MASSGERGAGPAGLPDVRWGRVEVWLRQSLRELDFRGKVVLAVGAGDGLLTCYIALHGAAKVVALEPELEGSTRNPRRTLLERVAALGLNNVIALADTLQDYARRGREFGVIL